MLPGYIFRVAALGNPLRARGGKPEGMGERRFGQQKSCESGSDDRWHELFRPSFAGPQEHMNAGGPGEQPRGEENEDADLAEPGIARKLFQKIGDKTIE